MYKKLNIMKNKFYFTVSLLIICVLGYAQVPQGIPYQAVARNWQGQPLANTNVKVRFSVLDSTATGTAVYVESHSTTTSALGLFTANVGMGTASTGTFSAINWGQNYKFLKVELDTTATGNSYIDLGTQQMMSVPYALYAGKAIQSDNNILNSNFRQLGFNVSSNWVCPSGVYEVIVELWGGGGGGAPTLVNNTCGGCPYGILGGSGGSGGYNKSKIAVIPGQIYPIVVGAGGNAGGGDGGNSSFDNILTAEGGKGGSPNGYPNCYGANGQSGLVINFNYPNYFTPPSYIPLGFTTIIPGLASGGASGGYMGNCNGPSKAGIAGENGFCRISF
jgi:hypothetical protein